MRPNRMMQMIKSKQGNCIMKKEEVLKLWAEYVEELYSDENRGDADMSALINKMCTISGKEIETAIKELPKEMACGSDNSNSRITTKPERERYRHHIQINK